MGLPKQPQIELPLLKALVKTGGEAKASDLYPLVATMFPAMTPADRAEKLSSGQSKWTNRVQWSRQRLIESGDMESGGRGIWRITDQGRARVRSGDGADAAQTPVEQNLQAIWDAYEEAFRTKTLDRLQALTPTQFERFAREFLRAYGFVDLEVTQVGPDGGIDGLGALKVGLATMNVAFQCKRWQGKVPRPEIDRFRGATQGSFEQGIFFTTSDFTAQAREASIKRGAIPIILINGEEMVEVMLTRNLGVAKRPIHLYEEVPIQGVDEEV